MPLNTKQQIFAEKVLSGNFSKLMLLGNAGTGKTHTLVEVITQKALDNTSICIACPTHAALNIIREKFDEKVLSTGNISFCTVASLLSRFGFKTKFGDTAFSSPKATRLISYEIASDLISLFIKSCGVQTWL